MSEINVNQVLSQMRAMAEAAQGGASGAVAPVSEGGGQFARMLTESIDKVSEAQQQAGALKTSFISGEPGIDLPTVMVAAQEADIAFQAMTQVRNRLLSAYQEIMNMPV
ncbi:MAG: flagellar hook-basal body complex protein FliE [Porticoccaceae bacterium]|nr:flagellar hook-basal body complex protein FliE [Porticoccaceae bacterium]